MDLTIYVYLTTRKETLPDLSSCKTESDFYKWKKEVKGVALYGDTFNEISDEIFGEAEKHGVVAGYALIEHPTDKMWEANDEIAGKLKGLFKQRRYPFSWGLSRDENAPEDEYVVSLEILVKHTPPSEATP